MLSLSQRCQYAVRAAVELAGRPRLTATSVADIAAAQAIPARFLEQILKGLKRAGIVGSRRGRQGGYVLLAAPSQVSIGDIVRLVDGPIRPVQCIAGGGEDCPLRGGCVFEGVWKATGEAISGVLDKVSLQDLLNKRRRPSRRRRTAARMV